VPSTAPLVLFEVGKVREVGVRTEGEIAEGAMINDEAN
jgi:hypothetical protein